MVFKRIYEGDKECCMVYGFEFELAYQNNRKTLTEPFEQAMSAIIKHLA